MRFCGAGLKTVYVNEGQTSSVESLLEGSGLDMSGVAGAPRQTAPKRCARNANKVLDFQRGKSILSKETS